MAVGKKQKPCNSRGFFAGTDHITGEFFKCWRRKTGCVTLVMSCMMAAGWARSQVAVDRLCISINRSVYVILSMDSRFVLQVSEGETGSSFAQIHLGRASVDRVPKIDNLYLGEVEWMSRLAASVTFQKRDSWIRMRLRCSKKKRKNDNEKLRN
jgi:hypothetical protein